MKPGTMIGGSLMIIMMVIIVIQFFPNLLNSITDMQQDDGSATKNSTTGVGVTTDTVILTTPLYEGNTAYVTSITSDNGGDTPVAASYIEATDTLTISGLAASGTRVLSLSYTADGLDGFTGLSGFAQFAPFLIFASIIIAAFAAMYHSASGKG